MTSTVLSLKFFLNSAPTALVEVASAKGSTPREQGAWMLVSARDIFGTIGGGQLEFMAIDKAREMLGASNSAGAAPHPYPLPLKNGERGASALRPADTDMLGNIVDGDEKTSKPPSPRFSRGEGKDEGRRGDHQARVTLDIPLGPEIGQCCGGRVELAIRIVDDAIKSELLAGAEAEQQKLPHVYIFGGGHVGHALASAMALLPVHAAIVETRADELRGFHEAVEKYLTPMPEEVVRDAPADSAFVVLTHDHALDFLIVAEALKRDDTAYVGMIGSKTKKVTFRNWFFKNAGGTEAEFARLVSPIGGDAVKDKRPAVIAALAAAEIITVLMRDVAPSETMARAAR